MIPQDFLDDLLSRTDIVEVIRHRVELKRAGREWKACCPFHDEKTPSFNVVPHKQFYHCFGCGAHGNALRFLMDYDRLEFPAAVEVLAQLAGVEIPREAGQGDGARHKTLLSILDRAHQRFREALKPDTPAARYLEKRGVSADMIRRFELGYAPPGWDFLASKLTPLDAAEAAGLVVRKDAERHYDRFRNRLIFPIRDLRGRVVAFGGRTLENDAAKYLNSPETPVFHKGQVAYGLFEARQAQRQIEQLIIVEGYMDVIALAEHGFDTAVATLGTATTADHLRQFLRQTRRLVFCFDGDAAGRRAADRALDVCLATFSDGADIRFLFLPQGDDPDDLVRREGREGFGQRLEAATPLSERLVEQLAADLKLDTTEGRAALVEAARNRLAAVDAPAFRALIMQRIEALSGLTAKTVSQLVGPAPARDVQRRRLEPPQRMTPVRRAIVLLLNYPACAQHFSDVEGLAASPKPGCPLIAELLDRLHHHPQLHCAALIQACAGRPEQEILERLAMVDLEIDETAAIEEFTALCGKLVAESRQTELEQLLAEFREGRLDDAGKSRLKELNRRPP